ncbi:MAG: SpoIIE family protein phosphatase, partial [Eubacteriales bacterium]|nr:SpoIIE family protein phosphatase [Eubacteriales bacterium]
GSVYLQPITRDHSYVQELVRCGLITAEEAKVHPNRNLITRAVGTSEILDVDTFSGDLYDGDVLLLCSDGLHGVLSDEELYSGITKFDDLDELCEYLVKLALKKGSKDNITVAVYRYDGEDCQ